MQTPNGPRRRVRAKAVTLINRLSPLRRKGMERQCTSTAPAPLQCEVMITTIRPPSGVEPLQSHHFRLNATP